MGNEIATLEAYARLKALRANLPEPYVSTKYVDDFHAILDLLEASTAIDLSSFRIREVRRVPTTGNWVTGEQDYSTDLYCDAPFFAMKVEGVLTMFEVLTAPAPAPGKPRIGFKA